jgi:hypothetical protein
MLRIIYPASTVRRCDTNACRRREGPAYSPARPAPALDRCAGTAGLHVYKRGDAHSYSDAFGARQSVFITWYFDAAP